MFIVYPDQVIVQSVVDLKEVHVFEHCIWMEVSLPESLLRVWKIDISGNMAAFQIEDGGGVFLVLKIHYVLHYHEVD